MQLVSLGVLVPSGKYTRLATVHEGMSWTDSNCTVIQMAIFTGQRGSTSGTKKAFGIALRLTRMCHQATPMQTLEADRVLPGPPTAMELTDSAMTTWQMVTHMSPQKQCPLCKLPAR